jgi:TonB-dependent SusC/RagA subfamily outer membrane receptor
VNGNSVVIRGVNTFLGSTEPLYLVNGSAVIDVGAITSIPIESIDRVEILKGSKTSLYGSRGANGVIAVFTKSGHYIIRGKIEFDMLGYNTPRKFYQPKYEIGKEPDMNYTLHWEPVIVTDGNGMARILFDKPLINGNYKFDIQGISYMGHVGYAEAVIGNE